MKGQTRPIRMKKSPQDFKPCSDSKNIFDQGSSNDSRPKAKHDLLKGQTRPINYEFKPCTDSNL